MKINKSLNLVIPFNLNGVDIFIHSTPLSHEVFELYFEPMGIALSRIYATGNHIAGPKIAALQLKKEAKKLGELESVNNGLFPEIRRLTNLVIPSNNGWETIPYQAGLSRGDINAEEAAEIESIVVFFILAYAIHGREKFLMVLSMLERWGARIESLNSTEFVDSLQTSIKAGNSGKQVKI